MDYWPRLESIPVTLVGLKKNPDADETLVSDVLISKRVSRWVVCSGREEEGGRRKEGGKENQ